VFDGNGEVDVFKDGGVDGGAAESGERKKGTVSVMSASPEIHGRGVAMVADEHVVEQADGGQVVVVGGREDEG
jgi:hypothetical protein